MPNPALIAAGIQLGSTALGKLFGGGKKTEAAVPNDLAPMRAQQIGLLNFLLGMGPDPRQALQGQAQQQLSQIQQEAPGLAKIAGKKGAVGKFGQRIQSQINAQLPMIQGQAQQSWAPQQSMPNRPAPTPFVPFGRGMANGGMVQGPGGPTDDMVPAMLSNGEGVLNTSAVQQIGGPDIIHLLNMLGQAQQMAGGGIAGYQNTEELSAPAVMPTQQWGGQMPVTMGPQINQALPQVPGMGGGEAPAQGGGVMTPQQRLESFYGGLNVNPSNLQNQASGAFSYMLNQPTPEQRATDISLPQLQQNLSGNASTQGAINGLMGLQNGAGADVEGRLGQIGQRPITGYEGMDAFLQQLAGGAGGAVNFNGSGLGIAELQGLASSNPGQAVMDALNPSFQRNLATANQAGGRFGSGNALMRGQAVENFNLQSAQALQRGVDQQTTAANALGQIGIGNDDLRLRGLLGGGQNQLGALQALITGATGRDNSALQANQILGSQRLQGQQQTGQNLANAGQLGTAQGQLGNSAANILGQLFGGQGAAERGLAGQAFNAGAVETGQQDMATQRTIELLNQLLQTGQSATMGGPVTQTASGAQQGADIGGQLAQLWMQSQKKGV